MNDLSKLLTTWEPEVPELSVFRRNVWQRIESSEARSRSGFTLWIESFFVSISRPRIAIATACAAIALGILIGGSLSAQSGANAYAYLRSVNPYAQVNPRS